jgi:hypothetical protein
MRLIYANKLLRTINGKELYRLFKFFIDSKIFVAVTLAFFISTTAFGNPEGGQVTAGNATISSPNASTVQINQSSDKAIIEWNSFNIAANEKTNFQQPSSSSIILNRISSAQGVSQIFGQLTATGRIILINSAGIFFGPSASVNVAGIIASTSNMSNENFLAGKYIFDQPSAYSGSVINKGTIKAGDSGLVALIGASVRNDGLIAANIGAVVLASGSKFTFDFSGDQLINFSVDAPSTSLGVDENGNPLTDSVSNSGKIISNGGRIIMTARGVNNVLNNTINMSGVLVANSVNQKNGVIILSAENGTTRVTGKIYASGRHRHQKGGTVHILGKKVELANDAYIDVSGSLGGGEVLIGGDYQGKNTKVLNAENTFVGSNVKIDANAIYSGNGGKVTVWANNNTQFYGNISARGGATSGDGGFVETSGKENLIFNGYVDTLAAHGKIGTLLLDPRTITIASTGSATLNDVDSFSTTPSTDVTIASSTINNAASNVILQANRDIKFNDNVSIIASGISLTAQAGRDIIVAKNISVATNNGNISFTANDATADGSNRSTGTGDITMNAGSSLNAGSGDINLAIGSSSISPFNSGSISLRNLAGNNITINGQNAVTLNNNSTINATGAVTIHANEIGSGGQDFVMGSGSSITTTDTSSNAVSITVNAAGGGTGLATLRDITTGNGGTITVTTNPNGSTTGSDITQSTGTLNVGSGTIILSTPKITGNNIGTSGNNITLIAGTLNATSGSSGIYITNLGSNTINLGTIDTSGTSGSAQITSNAAVAQIIGGTITVNNLTVKTTNDPGAAITISNLGNTVSAIDLESRNSTDSVNANGIISYRDTAGLNIIGLNTTNTATIIAGDAVTQSSDIAASVLMIKTLNNSGAAITLSRAGNEVDTIDLSTRNAADSANTAGAINYRDATGFDIANIGTSSTLDLTAAGTITQSGALTITGTPTFTIRSGNFDILLASATNNFLTTPVISTAAGGSIRDFSLRNIAATAQIPTLPTGLRNLTLIFNNTNLTLPAVTLSGNLIATAGSSISQLGALVVNGSGVIANFSAGSGSNITLTDLSNDFTTLQITSGNDVSISDINSLILGTSTVSGNLTVATNGAITQSGMLNVSGSGKISTFAAGALNNVTLNNTSNNFSAIAISNANDVSITDLNALSLGTSAVSGNLIIISNGDITQIGALTVNGLGKIATFSAGASNNIALTNVGNDFTTVAINTANNVSIVDANALDLGMSTISGTLTVTTNGSITSSGNLSVGNTATFSAGATNNITLNNNNDFISDVRIISANNVVLNDVDDLELGAATISGTLDITTGDYITNSGALSVVGATTINSNGNDVTLGNASNNFSSVAITSGRDVLITDIDALVLGSSTITGNLTVNSSGTITQSGALTINGSGKVATFAAGSSNDITLNNVANNFSIVEISSGNNVSISDVNALILGPSIISGNLVVNTNGAITQNGALLVNGSGKTTTLNAGNTGVITLNNVNNDFATVAIINAQSANIKDSSNLILNGISLIQNFTSVVGGSLTTTGLIQTAGGSVNLSTTGNGLVTIGSNGIKTSLDQISNGGAISITAANTDSVDPAIIINGVLDTRGGSGGILAIGGSVQLNQAPNVGAGNITLRGAGTSTTLGTINFTSATIISTLDADIIINGAVTSTGIGSDLSFLADSNNNGTGGVRITNIGSVNSSGNLTFSGSDLFLNPGTAIEFQAGSSAVAAGTILITGNVGNSDLSINGSIQSTNSGSPITLNAAGAGQILLGSNITSNGGALIIGNDVNLNSNVSLITGGGTITANNAIHGEGNTLTIDVGNGTDINFTNTSNNFGTISITHAKNVNLVDSAQINLGASTIAGTFDLTAGGDITSSGALNITGNANLSVGVNNITLNSSSNDFSTVAISSGHNVVIVDANAIDLGASTITGLLNVTAGGDITDSGLLAVTGIATFNSGVNNIILDNVNFFDRVRLTANNVTLNGSNTLRLGLSNIAGNFTVTAGGNITNIGVLTVAGIADFNVGSNNITLDQANHFSTVRISSANNVILHNSNSLDLGTSTINGTLLVSTTGNITNNGGVLSVGGVATFNTNTSSDITLANSGNNFSTIIIPGANNVSIADINSLNLGPSAINGNLTISAGGHITQSGALTITGTPTFTLTGINSDILLANYANDFNVTPVISNNGNVRDLALRNISATAIVPTLPAGMRNLTLSFDNASIVLPGLSLTNNASVVSSGTITQSGSLSILGVLTTASIGGITLINAANAINSFNGTNTSSGAIQLVTTAAPLTITGITQSGGGGIALTNIGTLSVANGAVISAVSSNVTLNATDLDLGISGAIDIGSGGLTLIQNTNGGSIVLGNGSGTMTITGDELARITANNLTINTSPNSQIIVDGVTVNNVANISGMILLSAATTTGTLGNIIFQGSSSSFKALTANANNGIIVNSPLSTTVGNLVLNADANGMPGTNDKLALNANLTSAGNINLSAKNGGIVLGASVSLVGSGITFNHEVNGAYDLTLNGGSTGNIVFKADVGNVARLGQITITNANNVTNNALMKAISYLQSAGTGTTDFGSNGINLTNNATINTDTANGVIDVSSLALKTNFANLSGFVDGLSGQAAISTITLLNSILPKTHFFDGIDMYSIPMPVPVPVPVPNNLPVSLLDQIPQITFSYLYGINNPEINFLMQPFLSDENITELLADLDLGKCAHIGLITICSGKFLAERLNVLHLLVD